MAFEFFGENVLASMKLLKEKNIYPELTDCGPTLRFIQRMSNLIKAMNSKDIRNSLRADPNCPQNKILTDFLVYLESMHEISKTKHPYGPKSKKVVPQGTVVKQRKTKTSGQRIFVGAEDEITSDAFLGLYVTIRATLELVKYLCNEIGFQFLMTRRLNQDALEHFFGDIRTACGSGSHPDPLIFIQLYRLLSLYSLVKPPRGSNVSGGEIFEALVQLQDLERDKSQDNKEKVIKLIDSIVEESCIADSPESLGQFTPEMTSEKINEEALSLMAGYVSFKVKKMKPAKTCATCAESLVCPNSESPKERERLIEIKTHGGLLRPSDLVYGIILQVEPGIIHTTSQESIHTNTIFSILENIRDHAVFPATGCDEHHKSLISAIVTFYLTVRMHFICRDVNKETALRKKRNKNMAKMARLQTTLAPTVANNTATSIALFNNISSSLKFAEGNSEADDSVQQLQEAMMENEIAVAHRMNALEARLEARDRQYSELQQRHDELLHRYDELQQRHEQQQQCLEQQSQICTEPVARQQNASTERRDVGVQTKYVHCSVFNSEGSAPDCIIS
ncbi:Transposable element P transposase [Frankliniella fusca]|uniref:Transposable element P transposase n=1 Tax=Frankliniella fusca TaxID=407009 RepID=A0AAE1LPQ8_9NEOP|nr:Transposable element P transposase [Frankliniella fusca]